MNLKHAYNRDEFVNFLKQEFLPDFDSDVRNINVSNKTKTIQTAKYLGECRDLGLQVFELKTSGKSEKKISQALDSFKILREFQSYKALVAYYSEDDQNWRFAFLQMTPDLTDKGKITNKYSNPRRYSFLIGPNAQVKTPEKYLIKDGQVKDFEDLQKRFSVEVVNKDFYREIARFFSRLVGGDTKLKSKTEHFQSELVLPSVDVNNHRAFQEYTVRLIGRIIFCWFLKQKKSVEGISLLPEEFLSSKAVETNNGYYHSILEPIFFEVLNKPREMRKPQFRNGYDRIPYLNGGLFDPHFDDFYEGQPNYALKIPDSWFKELFDILETYNFTIDENTALDVDLSIDPEMLGRIFENLLAEINPETGESARKSTGSYYTPRQIVEYMVDQSLIQYLITKTEIDEDKLKALVSADTEDDEIYPLNNEDKQKIVNALNEVKIIDPACGSGAFPIGILQKIVWMLGKVDIDGRLWFDKKLENLDPLLHEDFKSKFENENFDYIRKTGVIRDSIYGVDIQSIAVEVSKLRCFLTLIVDEDIDERKDNRGIKPLPNLEFKFVSANSLVNLPGSISSNKGQATLFEEDNEIKQLKKLRDIYFVSNGYEKEKVKNKFKDVQKEMFKKQISKSGAGTMTMALADWDPFADKVSAWFDSEWMLGNSHFDIVIANPPYGANIDKYIKIFNETYPQTSKGFKDIYKYFFNCSLTNFLKENGVLCFITPNTFFLQPRYSDLRKYLLEYNIISLINLGEDVFEAVVPTAITLVTKNKIDTAHNVLFSDISDSSKFCGSISNLASIEIEQNSFMQTPSYIFTDNIRVRSSDEEFLENVLDFKDAGINYQRVNVGLGSKGNSDLGQRLLYEGVKENENHVEYWKGTDINSFYISPKTNRFVRPDIVLRENERVILNKTYFSCLPKLLWRQTASIPIVAVDRVGIWFGRSIQSGVIKSTFLNKLSYDYLCCILNSSYIRKLYEKNVQEGGRVFPQVKLEKLKSLPIKIILLEKQIEFIDIAKKIMAMNESADYSENLEKQKIVQEYEKQINQMVYKLYGLTPEEIEIIENHGS